VALEGDVFTRVGARRKVREQNQTLDNFENVGILYLEVICPDLHLTRLKQASASHEAIFIWK
jgi:gamma-glutamylcysteine synthetase